MVAGGSGSGEGRECGNKGEAFPLPSPEPAESRKHTPNFTGTRRNEETLSHVLREFRNKGVSAYPAGPDHMPRPDFRFRSFVETDAREVALEACLEGGHVLRRPKWSL